MGTTAEKGAYIIETKSLLKDKINNLGCSIDDNTTFRQYANQLQNVYNNLPKTDYAEGTEINLGKTIKGKLDFDKIYQEVEYISGTGTQYINTGVLGGLDKKVIIKCSVKSIADYTLYGSRQSTGNTVSYISTASATSSWQSGLGSSWLRAENNSLVVDEICTIESYLSSGEQYIKKNGTTIYSGNRKVSLATFTQNDYLLAFNNQGSASQMANANLYDCKIYQNNVLVRHFIPCYRKTDNVIGLYDKVEGKFYTNAGTGTFTKGADVGSGFGDIVGIGQSSQDSTKGYQLLNVPDIAEFTDNGVTLSAKDGIIYVKGTPTINFAYTIVADVGITTTGNCTLVRNGSDPTNSTISLGLTIGDTEYNGTNQASHRDYRTFTATGTVTTLKIRFIRDDVITNFTLKPMLYLGDYDSTKEWEKYTGGIASPNPNYPYPIQCVTGNIEEVVGGINLIDMVGGANGNYDDKGLKVTDNQDGTITLNGTLTSNATISKISKSMNVSLISGQTYTLWVEQVSGSVEGGNFSKLIFQDNTQITGVSGNTSQAYQYTPSQNYENNINFGIHASSGRVFNNLKLRVMLVKGSYTFSQLTYEPYITPTSYQLSLGDIELNAIGNYKDELVTDRSTGKWYKLKNVEKITLNGTEEGWNKNSTRYSFNISGYDTGVYQIYCNYFFYINGWTSHSNTPNSCIMDKESGWDNARISFNASGIASVTDGASWKAWLSTHNTIVCYPLATPTLTEITDTTLIEQIENWYNAHSNNGTTIITSNGNLPMIIKVRALKGE